MKINRTNTIHFFAIIAVLLMPLMFTRPEEELTFTLYLFKSVTSVAMLLVFYVNFLWLVPKLIETDDKMKFVSINFFFIISIVKSFSDTRNKIKIFKTEVIFKMITGRVIPSDFENFADVF